MKTHSLWLGLLVMVIIALVVGTFLYRERPAASPRPLGLSRSDLSTGGQPKVAELHEKVRAVADQFFHQHDSPLRDAAGGTYLLTENPDLSRTLPSFGYQSSFYYYHWDIFLPYTLKSKSGKVFMAVVQLSDETPGNHHDVNKFHVVRAFVLDENGAIVRNLQ